jgi:hypothetical protein
MKLFKLTKGSVSVIRRDQAGIDEAKAQGFTLDGEVIEVNGGYEPVYAKVEKPEQKRKGWKASDDAALAESDGE